MDKSWDKLSNSLIALYAILAGILFFLIQTVKIFSPDTTTADMANKPLGYFDWGFIWADTLVAGPALFFGGVFMILRNRSIRKIGGLLVFAGFAINLYAMIAIWIGFPLIGQPTPGNFMWTTVVLTFLGVLAMIWIAIQAVKDDPRRTPK